MRSPLILKVPAGAIFSKSNSRLPGGNDKHWFLCSLRLGPVLVVGCVALGPKSRIIREIMKQFWSFFKKHFRNAQRRPQGVCMSSGVLGIDQNTVMRLFSQTEIFEAGKSRFPWFLTILDRKYLSDGQL